MILVAFESWKRGLQLSYKVCGVNVIGKVIEKLGFYAKTQILGRAKNIKKWL